MKANVTNASLCLCTIFLLPFGMMAQQKQRHYKFDFGNGNTEKGYAQVLPEMKYNKLRGFGFLQSETVSAINRGGKEAITSDFITSHQPIFFTVDLPEGNYNVSIITGDLKGTSSQTVRAECRRLMTYKLETRLGELLTTRFTVHIRNAAIINTTDTVKLKPREVNYLHWDNQLTLEINGEAPKINAIEITKNDEAITLFLAGNSTVVDQAYEPYAAWGQMLPVFFKPHKIAVANYAESGETLSAFERENRLAKIFSLMKKGDYLFIEFAHNDQKPGTNHLDPFTSYKQTLKHYISETRKRGGYPLLVTSMHRRNFDSTGKIINTLAEYPEAVRQTGKEEQVPVIDLNAMSKILYEAWGPEKSLQAFVHYPAGTFPGQVEELKDNTHFSPYGAYQLAKCVIEGLKEGKLEIGKYLKDDLKKFDPSHPDPIKEFYWPLSPTVSAVKPDGN